MKRFILSISVSVLFIAIVAITALHAKTSQIPLQESIASGVYLETAIIKIGDLRNMPVPASNEDYALLQSIGKVTSVVIGNFGKGCRKITLIQDKDSDGTVDRVSEWYVDRKEYVHSSKPSETYSSEKFKQLKQDILQGKRETVKPNWEGLPRVKEEIQSPDNVRREGLGYRAVIKDADTSQERVIFTYADRDNQGVDLVFEVKYYNKGVARVSPPINYSVYCKGSRDSVIKEAVVELEEATKKIADRIN